MTHYEIGDVFPVETLGEMDCPAIYARTQIPVPAQCVLDKGHEGQHVAAGADGSVVAVWDEEVEVWE